VQKEENGGAETPHFFDLEPLSGANSGPAHPLIAGIHLRSGDLCPNCRAGRLDYDGLLNLTCPQCGFSPGGGCFS
jgi:uncharacterized protein (DUF983 family)